MNWVFDASITAAWAFEGEKTKRTELLLDRLVGGHTAIVPAIWPLEVGNVLALASRRKRISAAQRAQFMAMLGGLPVQVDATSLTSIVRDVMPLADKYALAVYDAAYLELALRLGVPLATLDAALAKAAHSAGVAVL